MQQKQSTDGTLLDQLKGTDDSKLEEGVEATEGVNGSTVQPQYSERKMRFYSVSESELIQISIINYGVTAFISIGSALFAFWFDIFKETLLANSIPEQTKVIISYIKPLLLFFSILFFGLAGLGMWWRKKLIKVIKKESNIQ